jgi:hypothetical protein
MAPYPKANLVKEQSTKSWDSSPKLGACWSLLSKYGNSTRLSFVGSDYPWSSIPNKLSLSVVMTKKESFS